MILKSGLVRSVECLLEVVSESKGDVLQDLRLRLKSDLSLVGIYISPKIK